MNDHWARTSGAFGAVITDAQMLEQKRIEAQAMERPDPVEDTIRCFLMHWDCEKHNVTDGARELMRRLGLRT